MSVNNNLQVGSGRIRTAKFTASGSWTAPAGVFSIQALAVGGGGGGGAAKSGGTNYANMGGGGGGGGVVDSIFPVVPGTTYTVTIGTGGAGANTSTSAGSNGTDTTFGSLFTAPGGQGGVSDIATTRVSPTSNPGGSMGGWGRNGYGAANDTVSAGHGCGAATPIIPVAGESVSGAFFSTAMLTYFNGISNVSTPMIHTYVKQVAQNLTILQNTDSNTTYYSGVKRTAAVQFPANSTYFSPGNSWKGLGAGGASVLSIYKVSDPISWTLFVDPTAGLVLTTSGSSPVTAQALSGTSGKANTGSGGGGSLAGGSNTSLANGGTGGSGYVEVSWVE